MIEKFKKNYPDLWQFICFNILSNISTLMRFVMTWIGTAVFVNMMQLTLPIHFFIFDYTSEGSHGLGGFLTFLIAEIMAQAVNFFVQKKWVFQSDVDFGRAAIKYVILAVLIIVVNLLLPGYVTDFCIQTLGFGSGLSATIASVVNTLLAVIVSYPLLKFWIMPGKVEKHRDMEK